jgi:hypothetical protein
MVDSLALNDKLGAINSIRGSLGGYHVPIAASPLFGLTTTLVRVVFGDFAKPEANFARLCTTRESVARTTA